MCVCALYLSLSPSLCFCAHWSPTVAPHSSTSVWFIKHFSALFWTLSIILRDLKVSLCRKLFSRAFMRALADHRRHWRTECLLHPRYDDKNLLVQNVLCHRRPNKCACSDCFKLLHCAFFRIQVDRLGLVKLTLKGLSTSSDKDGSRSKWNARKVQSDHLAWTWLWRSYAFRAERGPLHCNNTLLG